MANFILFFVILFRVGVVEVWHCSVVCVVASVTVCHFLHFPPSLARFYYSSSIRVSIAVVEWHIHITHTYTDIFALICLGMQRIYLFKKTNSMCFSLPVYVHAPYFRHLFLLITNKNELYYSGRKE